MKIHKLPKREEMEFICPDANGSGWMFHAPNDRYYRVYPSGEYTMIFGRYLIDPAMINGDVSSATVKLWQHRQKRLNSLLPES